MDSSKKQLEFLFCINQEENIVCQRYINVRKKLIDIDENYDLITDVARKVANIIENDFKYKSENFIWNIFERHHRYAEPTVINNEYYLKEDNFIIILKLNGRELFRRLIDGNVYPPKIRYSADIRKKLPKIIEIIEDHIVSE